MNKKVLNAYIYSVITLGIAFFGVALLEWRPADHWSYTAFIACSVLASMLKVRLPGITGTFSLNFLILLLGVACFSVPETMLACIAGAVTQSFWRAKKRPTPVQLFFNVANLSISTGAAFFVAGLFPLDTSPLLRPAVLALAAATFFIVNTVVVSGVLSLLEGKPLTEVWKQWYFWYFPYFLIASALVGLLPVSGQTLEPSAWLILVPLLYLIHFFYGITHGKGDPGEIQHDEEVTVPTRAFLYIATVIAAGAGLVAQTFATLQSFNPQMFPVLFLLALAASTCKIRLPGMTGTISLSFVLILAAFGLLSLGEVILISAASAVVQMIWMPKVSPKPVQVVFSAACLVVAAAVAFLTVKMALPVTLTESLPAQFILATLTLYTVNTGLVAGVICLVEGTGLSRIWQHCCFWSLPYYLVGAAFAALIVVLTEGSGWQPALLYAPLLSMVYVSYRLHLRQAVGRT